MRRVALALVLIFAVAACGRGDDDKKVAASDDTTTSTVEDTTTTAAAVTTTGKPAAATTVKPANTLDKKCVSAQSQNNEANNQPLSIEICINDASPSPTQRITLTVTADDPDAPIGEGQCDIYVDWEGSPGSLCRDALIPPGPNSPQRTPQHGHRVKTFDHVYTDAGQETVSVAVWSGPGDGHPDPYDNYAGAQIPITVK